MPCYRCGARQVDPARGASTWRVGVRAGAQVLVCPDCQPQAELDACPACTSTSLVRRLGETWCKHCGTTIGSGEPAPEPASVPDPRLAEDVAAALSRALRSGAMAQAAAGRAGADEPGPLP